jgi:hypothetical protein
LPNFFSSLVFGQKLVHMGSFLGPANGVSSTMTLGRSCNAMRQKSVSDSELKGA